MSTDTPSSQLIINKLTKQQYDSIQNPSETELYLVTDDSDFVEANSPITGATKCKVTYDSKGLITSGTDLSASDIPNIASEKVNALTGYSKPSSSSSITTSDTLNSAIGKLEKALDNKQDIITDISYIRTQISKMPDKINGIDINNSGSTLPTTTSYSVGDTFLNTTDKKIYTVEAPAWQLNSDVTVSNGVTVDLQTGIVSGFYTNSSNPQFQQGISRQVSGSTPFGWSGSMQYNIHIKLTSLPNGTSGNQLIRTSDINFCISTEGLYAQYAYSSYGNPIRGPQVLFFNYNNWVINKEYYITIIKNSDGTVNSYLRENSYNGNVLSSGVAEYANRSASNYMRYGMGDYPMYSGTHFNGVIYLADSTGDFLLADGSLTWDSGTTLEDNTQYNDTTNEKTIYYNNNILYESGSGLPDQSGQSGKYLTTNGTSASWATVQAGPKFLTFTNITASTWISDSTYTDYGYKCVLTCNGVTSSDYAQVIFNPAEADSGNYAALCLTDTNTVTIYSKVNNSISIPTIMVMGA